MVLLGREFRQLLHRSCISCAGGEEKETTKVLSVVETLQGEAKLTPGHGQLCQLLPLDLTLVVCVCVGGGGEVVISETLPVYVYTKYTHTCSTAVDDIMMVLHTVLPLLLGLVVQVDLRFHTHYIVCVTINTLSMQSCEEQHVKPHLKLLC